LADDEESRTALKTLRARFLAEFTLSETRRSFAPLRMTANGLGMTAWRDFPAACKGAIIIRQLQCDGGSVVSATGATASSGTAATAARVCRAATGGDASTSTGVPATGGATATGIAPTVRAASTLSVGHDDGP
jgi:hypothetical protein